MAHVLKRVGTGVWVALAVMVVGGAALVKMVGVDAAQTISDNRLIEQAEFQPLHARKSVLVIDVREADSFANGHIPGAMHVSVREITSQLPAVRRASKGRLIVTYCSCPTEASSLRAAAILSEAKLAARALVGGFPKWVESGGAIER